jgi:hypothetical protein
LVSKLRENKLLYSSHLPLGVPNGLVIHHASGTPRGPFLYSVLGQDKENHAKMNGIERWRQKRAQVARPGKWPCFHPIDFLTTNFTSFCPSQNFEAVFFDLVLF